MKNKEDTKSSILKKRFFKNMLIIMSDNGISGTQLARSLNINYRSLWNAKYHNAISISLMLDIADQLGESLEDMLKEDF